MFVQRLKLRPPQLLPFWLERPQLERRLHPGVRVLAIIAGPGYGKTVLAARLHASWTGPKLWYSLDDSDADLALFAGHLDAGIRALGGDLPPFNDSAAGSTSAPREVGLRFAQGLADLRKPPLLVLDDVQALEGSRSLVALNELVERACRVGASFVLTGRSMPLALHGLAASAQLASVGAGDLTFDDAEAQAYLQQACAAEMPASLVSLVARAEGWPAGLALIATGTRETSSTRPTVQPRSGLVQPLGQGSPHDEEARRHLFSYLANEVFERLTPEESRFLVDTSILEQLDGALCDAVCDAARSADLLNSLAERGIFISRQSEDAFRYHQLFREFLLHHLAASREPSYIRRLHRRAADFFSTRDGTALAVSHYVAAQDVEAAVAQLEASVFSMLRAGLIRTVGQLLRGIDQARIEKSPTLLAALGRILRERGEWDAALPTLERAIATARAGHQFDVLAEAVRFCAPILASRGEFERLRLMLDEALSPGLDLPETSITSLRMTSAAVYLEMDRLDESLAAYREVMPSIAARGDLAAHGLLLHNTAVAHLRRGDVYAGLSLYERALKLKTSAGQRLSMLTTLGDLIYAKTLLGDVEDAERLVETMLEQATDAGAAGLVARAHEERGVLKLLRGDVAGARQAFTSAIESSDPSDIILLPEIEHGLGKCALLEGKLSEADERCARAIEMFRSASRHQQVAPILVTRAQVTLAKGDALLAARFASDALEEGVQGANALIQAITSCDAAAVLVLCCARLAGQDNARMDRRAAEAATSAIALIHQRDYRFLLRTKADAFAELHPHLRRWKIGAGLVDIGTDAPFSTLRIEMLGPLRVFVGGREMPPEAWKRRRAIEIFAYLVSQRGRAVARDRLVDLFWPESEADSAHDNLRVTITAIRKAVGDVIRYESNAYRFAAPNHTIVDFEQFDGQVDQARQAEALGDRAKAREAYEAAARLYRGDFLESMHEGGWQWRERERLRAACIEALRWLASDHAPDKDIASHRQVVERLLEVAPFDLDAVRMRLEALVAENRGGEADRDYRDWRTRYKIAVGADAPDIWAPPQQGVRAVRDLSHTAR